MRRSRHNHHLHHVNRHGSNNNSGLDQHNLSENTSLKNFFKVAGPICLLIAIILITISIVDFFIVFNGPTFGPQPTKGYFFFLALPFFIAGAIMTNLGYMGHYARYTASQIAPVAKDVTNYMVDGTKESLKTVAVTVSDAIKQDKSGKKCLCGNTCPIEAKFCTECGRSLTKNCPLCNSSNEGNAKFCLNCGERL